MTAKLKKLRQIARLIEARDLAHLAEVEGRRAELAKLIAHRGALKLGAERDALVPGPVRANAQALAAALGREIEQSQLERARLAPEAEARKEIAAGSFGRVRAIDSLIARTRRAR